MDNRVMPMIHKFKQNGMDIVLDVNSGIVHVVDDMTYDVLDYYKGDNREDVLKALDGKYDPAELGVLSVQGSWTAEYHQYCFS